MIVNREKEGLLERDLPGLEALDHGHELLARLLVGQAGDVVGRGGGGGGGLTHRSILS